MGILYMTNIYWTGVVNSGMKSFLTRTLFFLQSLQCNLSSWSIWAPLVPASSDMKCWRNRGLGDMMGIIWDYDIMGLLRCPVSPVGAVGGHMGNNNITQPSPSSPPLPGIASIQAAGRDCSLLLNSGLHHLAQSSCRALSAVRWDVWSGHVFSVSDPPRAAH